MTTAIHYTGPGGFIVSTEAGVSICRVNVDDLTPEEAAEYAEVICDALNRHAATPARAAMQ
jgi:hypothetical protein